MRIPTRQQSFELLWHHNIPQNVIRHSIAVSRLAEEVAQNYIKKHPKAKINLELLDRACLLHDISKIAAIQKGKNEDHGELGYELLKKHGYPEVAIIVRKHPLHCILDAKRKPKSLEEKILFYADKRVKDNKVVTLKERLSDLRKRYPEYKAGINKSGPLVLKLEMELGQ